MIDQEKIDGALELLERCSERGRCTECPLNRPDVDCITELPKFAIRVIKELLEEKERAEHCIYAIEDALDRGSDNDYARAAIKEYWGEDGRIL